MRKTKLIAALTEHYLIKIKPPLSPVRGGKSGGYAIPGGVTSIGDHAFFYCTNLTGVTIPNSVTNIGDYAFDDCLGLTGIIIPNSVANMWKLCI